MHSALTARVLAIGLSALSLGACITYDPWRGCNSDSVTASRDIISDCTAVIDSAPQDTDKLAQAYLKRGMARRLAGEFRAAIDDYTQAIRYKPDYAEAYANRAFAYFALRHYDEAIQDYSGLIRLRPNDAEGYSGRGGAYLEKKEYLKAVSDLSEALRLRPDHWAARRSRAEAYFDLGEYDRAIADYSELISKWPSWDLYFDRASVRLRKGDYDGAISDLDESIRLNSSESIAYNNRCFVRAAANKELDLALADCNRGLDARNLPLRYGRAETTLLLNSRGFVYLRMSRYGEAIADFNEALNLDPRHPHALFLRGICKLRLGDRTSGRADINAAATSPEVAAEYARYGVTP